MPFINFAWMPVVLDIINFGRTTNSTPSLSTPTEREEDPILTLFRENQRQFREFLKGLQVPHGGRGRVMVWVWHLCTQVMRACPCESRSCTS